MMMTRDEPCQTCVFDWGKEGTWQLLAGPEGRWSEDTEDQDSRIDYDIEVWQLVGYVPARIMVVVVVVEECRWVQNPKCG
jgi:hypothetical protein